MKRRSFRKSRTFSRSSFRRKSGKSGRRGGGMGGDLAMIAAAGLYGAGRGWMSQKLDPITSKVAGVAGEYADEVVMGGLGYLLMKGKIPVLNKWSITRDIGRAAVVIEAARIGSGLASGLTTPTSSAVTASTSPVYGV